MALDSPHPCQPNRQNPEMTSAAPIRLIGVMASRLLPGRRAVPRRARGMVRDSPTVATAMPFCQSKSLHEIAAR